MKLDNKCIVCGSPLDLNTILNITMDEVKYDVAICDKHSDDTTPKQVKELVIKKINTLKDLINGLKDFGININDLGTISVAAKDKVDKPEPVIDEQKPELIDENKSVKLIRKERIPTVKVISGNINGYDVKGNESIKTEDVIDKTINELNQKSNGKIKVVKPITEHIEEQVISAHGGQMTIPKKIKHNIGTTLINVVKTDDKMLQERFRRAAANSMKDEHNDKMQECTHCNGTGVGANTRPCPRCNGSGILV